MRNICVQNVQKLPLRGLNILENNIKSNFLKMNCENLKLIGMPLDHIL